ncbi:unnamed protein product [Arabidopsis lyrata]|nr:unnamed protein product [Arabidopsis lyrata]
MFNDSLFWSSLSLTYSPPLLGLHLWLVFDRRVAAHIAPASFFSLPFLLVLLSVLFFFEGGFSELVADAFD